MLRNYLIIAWRNLWNNKVFSLINIVGLAVAMAASLLIYVYISFERSYDNFHEHGNNIYRLITTRTVDGVEEPSHSTLGSGYGPFLKSNLPEIEEFARLQIEDDTEFDFQYGPLENQSSREDKVFYADPSFLDMFSFPLLVGDATTALDEPNSIVITESLAKKYLGWNPQNDQPNDILDQSIIYNKTNFKITGVAKDIPSNSHIKFNALISVETIKTSWWRGFDNEEGMGECILYYLLNPNTDVTALTEKIVDLFEKRYAESMKKLNITFSFQLQPIREIHLSSGDFKGEMEVRGDIRIVRFLIIICLFILAIAWTNYINLNTTRSMKRAKEVGIKKIVGAGKKQLIEQFLVESTMVNLIALLLAITMAQVLLPYFEQLIGKDLQVGLFNRELLIIIFGFLVLGVFVSGLYPALLLSSFKSFSILSGIKNRGSNRVGLRKTLVVIQYMITFSLILGTFTVNMQLSHMRNSDLGFNMEQMLIIRVGVGSHRTIVGKFNVFKNNLRFQKGIGGVTASYNIPGGERMGEMNFIRKINNEEVSMPFPVNSVERDFFETYGIKLIFGRTFSSTIRNDRQCIIIMEQTARDLGFENPEEALEGKIYTTKENQHIDDKTAMEIINPTIIGIVEDFYQNSLKTQLQPIIFQRGNSIKKHNLFRYFSIRLALPEGRYNQLSELIASVEKNYHQVFPENAFNYFFLDDFFNQQYQSDQKFGSIIAHFSILAVVIACLGMFGLSLFTLQQRTKEIGIRKVHGAPILGILALLSKDFIKLIILSILVAIPITFVPLKAWLQTFAYRINLSWWLFVIPAITIIIIAILTISYQSIKAALANPVKALRYE